MIGFHDKDFDELFAGREAFGDYMVCVLCEAYLALFETFMSMERINY